MSRQASYLTINGIQIDPNPKAVINAVLTTFEDIKYWSKDALENLYIGSLEMATEYAVENKSASNTRFNSLTKQKIKRFNRVKKDFDRNQVLNTIYNEILASENKGFLNRFGFSNKFQDKLRGNSETQSCNK